MSYRFVIADVFTETPFGGNPLAVFPEADGLSERAMRALAREFNLSETVFVLRPREPGRAARLRIFTPRTELPFAGHPTVGAAVVLAELGAIEPAGGAASVVFEEGIGPVLVEIRRGGPATVARFVLEREVEIPQVRPAPEAAAAALSLPAEAVRQTWFASAGVPFCFVRLADAAAVDRAALDRAAWAAEFAAAWASSLYLFAGDPEPGARLYARMFAPAHGIEEDPATGSASAALAGSLAARRPEPEGRFAWRIVQGVAMGRPSAIEAAADKRGGRVVRLAVGGAAVVLGEGRLRLPDGF